MTSPVYHFGGFALDPAARELRRADALVALPPKSFDCLAYLIEKRERAVGRDELISAVWGRVDVNDALLAQTVLRARRAVGDTGTSQTAIRTVPRFGYRWIAELDGVTGNDRSIPAEESSSGASTTPSSKSIRKSRRRVSMAIAAMLLVVAGAIAAITLHRAGHRVATLANPSLVVVMPVEVDHAGPENAWIRLGAMDYIAARLRTGGGLTVLPSEQVVALSGSASSDDDAALARVAHATGARWIVRPSARRVGSGWLIHLADGAGDEGHQADATGATVLLAAADASTRLLAAWGYPKHSASARADAPNALTERVQRVDAAMLGGDLVEARRLIDGAASAERSDPSLRVREGQLEFRAGRIDTAQDIFNALSVNEAPLPAPIRAQASMGLGAVAVRRGDFPRAEKRYAEALAVLGDRGDPNLVGLAYTGRGVARGAQDNFDLALADLGRARVALERAGNPLDAASVETDLGLIEGSRRRYAQALGPFDSAIATFERFDVQDNLAASLLGKARAQLALLDHDGALASSKRAYDIAAGLENTVLVRNIALARANALIQVGQLRAADAIVSRIQPNADDDELPGLRARLALARGDNVGALAAMDALIDRKTPLPPTLLPLLVRAALAGGGHALAQRVLDRAGRGPLSKPDDTLAIELARGEFAMALGDRTAALAHLKNAVAAAGEGGVPAERVRAGCAYARVLIADGSLDQASAVVGEMTPYADRDFRVAQISALLFRALGDKAMQDSADARVRALAGERDPGVPAL